MFTYKIYPFSSSLRLCFFNGKKMHEYSLGFLIISTTNLISSTSNPCIRHVDTWVQLSMSQLINLPMKKFAKIVLKIVTLNVHKITSTNTISIITARKQSLKYLFSISLLKKVGGGEELYDTSDYKPFTLKEYKDELGRSSTTCHYTRSVNQL